MREVRMFRTSRLARQGRAVAAWMREARLPRDERRAARAERAAEKQMNLERDNPYSAERRADAAAAQHHRRATSDDPGGWLP